MKHLLLAVIIIISFYSVTQSQIYRINESFENYDSLTLPPGWTVWNEAPFPIQPFTNWTVRDTGTGLPGVSSGVAVAHTGRKAIGVSWYSGIDTLTNTDTISDAWLVTKRITGNGVNDYLGFWMAGGTPTLIDSLQIWVSTIDSIPSHFNHYIETLVRGPGVWGTFIQEILPLDAYAGQTMWIGFRYFMNVTNDGVFVHLDDIQVFDPIGIKPIGTEIPGTFSLHQNYPNPFNPVTYIIFELPKTEFVNITLYNTLGQEVKTLLNENKTAGSYKIDFDASFLSSGTYFYRITAGSYAETKKMVLVK